MFSTEEIALPCPYCKGEIYQPLAWFKQTYNSCPACGGGLLASQFDAQIAEIEQSFETCIAERVQGQKGCGCNCNHGD